MKTPIYLDYSATTPVDPRVAQKMIPWLTEHFGNPASRSHAFGWDADIIAHHRRGGHVLGLCGGYQMLGTRISDPDGQGSVRLQGGWPR